MKRIIKFLQHKEIDFDKWDACVGSSEFPKPYGFSWYLNWLTDQWQAVVYGDYEAVLPLFIQSKYGIQFSSRPYGTQSVGPYSKIPLTPELLRDLVHEAMKHVQYSEFFMDPGVPLTKWKSMPYSNYTIDTSEEYEILQNRMSSQNKRNLKKAEKAHFELAEWANVKDAVQLWQNNIQKKTRISHEDCNRLGKLLEFCHYQKRGVLYAVRDEYNQLCGAQFWVVYQGRSTLMLNASTPWGKSHGVSTWLIDRHLRSVSGRPHQIDFEGSSILGLKRFYSGFGAKDEPFFMHVENRLPLFLRWLKTATTR
ncbi:hypothetical protein OAQ85_01840 [Schleiferiaceae bacterium]|nr:hypothetical protein [Schleiferiaceae bacterium]|tara:strand:+ start:193 stop:1119 length:927 start_codon:yes stop_codon:yes gene_type:complete